MPGRPYKPRPLAQRAGPGHAMEHAPHVHLGFMEHLGKLAGAERLARVAQGGEDGGAALAEHGAAGIARHLPAA